VATLVASWLPTRQATRVGPLEALRPQAAPSVRTQTGRVRTALALLLLAGGAAVLGLAVAVEDDLVMVAGGGLFFLGILVLGPVLVPAVITLLARLAGPLLGRHGRLAAANAVRNPRRTAATTAALLVGVTLAAAVLTGMATTRTAMTTLMAEQHPVDVALTADRPLPAAVPSRLGSVRGAARAVTVPGVDGTVHGTALTLLAPDRSADTAAVLHDTGLLPAPGTVRLPLEVLPDVADGDLVTVGAGTGQVTLEVTRGEGWGTAAALVAPATLAELGAGVADRAVWVRAEPDADPERLSGDLTAAAGGVHPEVVSGLTDRRWVDLQLDVLTWSVLGLLAIGVLIALVGIANTLGLSVLERTREHALLRALGLTRRGLRRLLATEGMLVALVATLIGTVVGTGFAWVGIQVMVRPAVESAPLTVPWAQLAVSVVVAGLAGLAAAVLPARRAARVAPAAGLGLD
jgi:putative ABC transport system permease protein